MVGGDDLILLLPNCDRINTQSFALLVAYASRMEPLNTDAAWRYNVCLILLDATTILHQARLY